MKPARRLILPALAAAPAVEAGTGLDLVGPAGFTRFTFTLDAFLIWTALNLAGLLLVGYPAAAAIARIPVPRPLRVALVLLAGLAGGGLFVTLVAGGDFRAAWIGFAPGGLTAAIWALFNADMLADRPQRVA